VSIQTNNQAELSKLERG